ncbi:hypothetical protein [Pannonibacter sp.]
MTLSTILARWSGLPTIAEVGAEKPIGEVLSAEEPAETDAEAPFE